MKLVLFVEGHTEKKVLGPFLKRWLDARLPRPVRLVVVRFEGWQDFYKGIEGKVRLHLTDPEVSGTVGLLDLYGPTFYPEHLGSSAERGAWAKHHIEARVDQPRFRQHFAVHETEAWLLSQPTLLPSGVARGLPGRAALQPESVNSDQPPAKLLDRLYRVHEKRGYQKVIDGANLFTRLDPDMACSKCPSLKLLLEDLLAFSLSPA